MSPVDEKELILREFAKIGPKIAKADAVLKDLYEQQNALIIRGGEAGLSAAAMARARQPESDDVKYLAESFRQILRRQEPKTKRAVKKTPLTKAR